MLSTKNPWSSVLFFGKWPCLKGDTSSIPLFLVSMLVFRGVVGGVKLFEKHKSTCIISPGWVEHKKMFETTTKLT